MSKRSTRYSEEFKQQIIDLIIYNRNKYSISAMCRVLKIALDSINSILMLFNV